MGAEATAGKIDTTEQVTPKTTPDNTNVDTDKDKIGESNNKTVQMSQTDLDRLMADRAGQAKRNAVSDLLKDLDVQDVTALKVIAESHKQAEEKATQAAEAAKSNEQRLADEIVQLKDFQVKSIADSNRWQIVAAIQRLAPGKDVPADRFADLLTLMDTSGIKVSEGTIDDKDVETAIDATLDGRDYLKANSSAETQKPKGSPTRKPSVFGDKGQHPATPQRNRRASM